MSTKPFAVRQRAVPGAHGVDRRRPWSSRRPTDTARRSCVGLGGQSYPHRRRSAAKLAAAAKALAGRQLVAPSPHGGRPTSSLVHTTIVRCDQAISRQPGPRLCPRRRRTATSAVSVESAPSATRGSWSTRGRPTPPLVLTTTDQAITRRPRRKAVSALSMVPPNEVRCSRCLLPVRH